MSMPTPENLHTVRRSAYELVFWFGNSASGRDGANRVVVQQFVPGICRSDVATFMLPEQQNDLERLERALLRAHAAGERDKAAELRKVLGL